MAKTPADDPNRDVREEVVARLESRGVGTSPADSPEDLVRLLDAVEAFEAAVERGGGDLMVDEPVAGRRASQPDDAAFVLPSREGGESARAYLGRIAQARASVDERGRG
jgi:hypothetical protein